MVLSGYLSPVDRYNLATGAGFTGPNAIIMAAISMFECGNCDMATYNKSGDSGLWQINRMHGYSLTEMADPVKNAAAAFAIWKSQGFNGC